MKKFSLKKCFIMINIVGNNLSILDDSVEDNKNICFITIMNDLLPNNYLSQGTMSGNFG